MLQLDYDEALYVAIAGKKRKFVILPLQMMIAVNALQSLNGLANPFSIWADYRDIYLRGIRYDIPDVAPVRPTPMPAGAYAIEKRRVGLGSTDGHVLRRRCELGEHDRHVRNRIPGA